MATVRLNKVTKIYQGNIVGIRDVHLDVESKEFLVLVGPSGCGKTTALRLIAGLDTVTEGEIYIGDRLVNDVPSKDRDIAMVFQNYALYPHMTVYENMAFGLRLRKFPKEEIVERVKEAAGILGIEDLLGRKPRELSGGERQRVAVGRAIVRKPQVFLFDEPLSNLDAKLRTELRAEINKLHTRLQSTMIHVTHDQMEAMTMGNRIAVMKDGVIQQVAEPITLYNRPVNKFVAGFIGSPAMNFMNGVMIKDDGRYYFNGGNFRAKIPEEMIPKIEQYEGKEVIFGIRAEDIYDKLYFEDAPPENTIVGTCEILEPLGSEVFLHLRSGKHSFIAKVSAHDRPSRNQDLNMVLDMSKAHFFNRDSGETII